MNKKKKREIDRLREAVNTLDEEQGVDIEFPDDDLTDTEEKYKDLCHQYRMELLFIILKMNRIPVDVFETEIREIKVNDKFIEISPIFNDAKPREDWRPEFRLKFITYLGMYFVQNMSKMVSRYYKATNKKKFIKWELKGRYINNMMYTVCNFIEAFHRGNKLDPGVLSLLAELSILSSYKDANEAKDHMIMFASHLRALKELFKVESCLIHFGTLFDEIIKLAYIGAVQNTYVKFVDYIPNLNIRDNKEISQIITTVGKRMGNFSPLPLFKYYIKSKPLLYYADKYGADSESLETGVLALSFFKFIVRDKNLSRYVDKIITAK